MKIAYLINQYPKVSHSFIRREILALERTGMQVTRIAIRGWDGELVDEDDKREREHTRYILQQGLPAVLWCGLRLFASTSAGFIRALGVAMKLGMRGDRPWPVHLVYLCEASQVALWLRQEGIEHLHAHFGTNSAEVAMLASMLSGVPYSFTVHGPDEFDRPEALGLGEKIAASAFTVAVSAFGRSQLLRWAKFPHWDRIKVIPCGVDQAFRETTPQPPPKRPRLVCVGRLCHQKGQMLLIEAAAILANDGVDFELVLASDGELRAQMEARITQLHLEQLVHITGWIDSARVREEILAARAMVLPSFAEGLPVVIMEAMALRRPVLSTYIAGIPELVRHDDNGWLIPAGNLDALCAALRECLTTPTDILERMGNRAREQVLQQHDCDKAAARLAGLFHDSSMALQS